MKKYLLIGIALLLTACSSDVASNEMETITDNKTKSEVELVEPGEKSLLLEWDFDNMDRGNHDYETLAALAHPRLVVELDYKGVKRGDVIYFKSPDFTIESNPDFYMPEYYIARVVGLQGETVEIKDGQVFDKRLDTFYSKLLQRGMNEKDYFEKLKPVNRGNEENDREYFATTMDPVKVVNNTVFVLVDNGGRGVDSRDFGLLPMESIKGKVLGYKK
ncbi:signal peptidase I [Paenisporosarcina sp. OV554]|uniref:signal peptidase I n=1 Tax=Paenisporosarcina sp. OV554 TaxID=2135694 RepID=UPI000D33DD44|nr:signal peptidase I [Paenisporosarcina sp. OV554]PUB08289.1 signal peptidase I [Paenisporosarcina sp. OV554]